jgi:hypothetical protein
MSKRSEGAYFAGSGRVARIYRPRRPIEITHSDIETNLEGVVDALYARFRRKPSPALDRYYAHHGAGYAFSHVIVEAVVVKVGGVVTDVSQATTMVERRGVGFKEFHRRTWRKFLRQLGISFEVIQLHEIALVMYKE